MSALLESRAAGFGWWLEQEHGAGADEPQQESGAKTMDATPSSPIRQDSRRCAATFLTGNGGVVRPRCVRERSTCSPAV